MKKQVPWNKGLTKDTDPRVKKNGENISKFAEGKLGGWNRGHTKSTDPRVKKNAKNLSESWKNKSKEEKKRIAKNVSEKLKGRHLSPKTEFKKGHSTSSKLIENWKDPIYKQKQLKAMLHWGRPNKQEIKVLQILKNIDINWDYVGNGILLIGGKNPDFINRNTNDLLEYFGNYWHYDGTFENIWEEELLRKIHFKKYGYNCVVVNSNVLKMKFPEEYIKEQISKENLVCPNEQELFE